MPHDWNTQVTVKWTFYSNMTSHGGTELIDRWSKLQLGDEEAISDIAGLASSLAGKEQPRITDGSSVC